MHRRALARVATMRAKLLFFGFLAIAGYLTWRLIDVQIRQGPVLAKAALAQRSDTVDLFARRGSILDRDGHILVRSLPSQSIYAVPHDIDHPDRVAAGLERVVGKLSPSVIADLHDRHLWFVWIARKVPHAWAKAVKALHLPGVQLEEEQTGRRYDAVGTLASPVIGFVGTNEQGLDGLEYAYNGWLRGHPGKETLETDVFGRPIPFGKRTIIKPARSGYSIELTIDSYLQFVAEQALGAQVKRYHASSGTAIVMNPRTGAVLAMASLPDFNPNRFWKYSAFDWRDRAVEDAYEPGSTYKLVMAAGALQSGKVTPQSRFPARNSITVGGRTLYNAEDGLAAKGATETLETIIADSLNVGAAEVGMSIGARTFYTMEMKAGFGKPTHIGLPGENPGIVPPPSQWSGSSLATMSFGQGVAVTPLALARYYCAIANGGLLLRPRIVRAVLNQKGKVVYMYPTEIERRIFSPKTARELLTFLRAVVTRGTGDPTAQIPGYKTAGKTGTAQVAVNGVYQRGLYIASFIGMVPYPRVRYVILVKVDHPVGSYYGTTVAAPAFSKIALAAMLRDEARPRPSSSPSAAP
ncbi:MAG: peptidoglycan D,D-transpeptidase FtsI family protein [Vulcanimicrobiaceae bacterium]